MFNIFSLIEVCDMACINVNNEIIISNEEFQKLLSLLDYEIMQNRKLKIKVL